MKKVQIKYLILLSLVYSYSFGQHINDSIINNSNLIIHNQLSFKYKQLIIPTILIGYGVWATDNDQLEFFNLEIKEEVSEHIDDRITMDDFTQYAPLVTVFALDFGGIKGKNNLKDKSIIATTSALIMGTTVAVIKKVSHVQRPDETSVNSFPSGHTATAFMGAELLFQEYKEVSLWYGISGYIVASATGIFRMLNNRHWLSDIVTGAGIGILSAKAGYWLYPAINKLFTNNKSTTKKTVFVPYYDGKTTGFGLVSIF